MSQFLKCFSVALLFLMSSSAYSAKFEVTCAKQIKKFCSAEMSKSECRDHLTEMAQRSSRDLIPDFDGTECKSFLGGSESTGDYCEETIAEVVRELASCWSKYSTGCINYVGTQYSQSLKTAGMIDASCGDRVESACLISCSARFSTGCRDSCADLVWFTY